MDTANPDLSQFGSLLTGIGLSLTGFLLLAFISILLIIFLVPVVLEFIRRARQGHQKRNFSPTSLK